MAGQVVPVVGEHDFDGVRYLLIRQTHGGTYHIPDWMIVEAARLIEIVCAPRFPVKCLLELRTLVDHLVASPLKEKSFERGDAHETSVTRATGFVCHGPIPTRLGRASAAEGTGTAEGPADRGHIGGERRPSVDRRREGGGR